MFKKFILAAILISNGAFASNVILTKHVTSGYTIPEDGFVKDCTIMNDGEVKISLAQNGGATVSYIILISQKRIQEIKSLVSTARYGRIVEVGATCDGGNKLLYGYRKGHKVILDENFDCGRHLVNSSHAAAKLKKLATKNCGF